MKKIIVLLVIIFVGKKLNCQTNADCINAIPLCTTPNFTFFPTAGNGNVNDIPTGNNISNPSTNPASSNSGCLLAGENVPQWLLITIGNPGNLEFVFGAGSSANPQVGYYDWAMWPYSATTCSNIMNNTLPPIRCNWNAISSGGTGIASSSNITTLGGNPGNFEPPLAVNSCEQFIICISNYSGVNSLVSFESLGTASLSCNPNCNPSYIICSGSNVTVTPVNFAGLTNPTYSLNPGSLTNTSGNFVLNPSVTTNYTTYITGLNSSNVVQTTTAVSTVTVNAQPSSVATTTQASCTSTTNAFNLGLTFTPVSPIPNYTVSWSPIPNGVSSPTQTSGSGGILAGVYTATITSVGGCSTTTSFSIDPVPPPISFNLIPGGGTYSITCAQPTVVINLNPAAYNYTWTNGFSAAQTGTTGYFTTANQGTWTVVGINPISGCVASQSFVVTQNLVSPTSTVTPTSQNITCLVTSAATFTAITTNTMTNVTHEWYSPFTTGPATSGGTLSIQSLNAPGTYTHCLVNNINGCSTCKTVTVVSSASFPTVTIVSPQQFTIGCGTTGTANISVSGVTTNPTGAAVTYTILPPSFVGPTYTTNGTSTFTANIPGQYTVITKQTNNGCETQIPISIIQNTFAPQITAATSNPTLTCDVPKTLLLGTSSTPNVGYSWAFPGSPGQTPNDTITVFTTSNTTNTVVATYTLTITDNINKCKSTQTLTIYQNIRKPTPIISGANSITCATPTINLTNGSTSNVPAQFFPTLPVIGYIWDGPSPQQQQQLSSNYIAYTPGTYTLTAKDLNNGCTAIATKTIADNRIYPIVNTPNPPPPFILDCAAPGATIYPVLSGPTAGFTYSWVAVPTASFSSYTSSITIVNKTGIYRIFVTNTSNGCVAVGNVQVINGGLTGNFSASTEAGFAPLNVNFTNLSSSSSTTSGTSNIISVWSFGNGTSQTTNSTSISPTVVYNNAGTYSVTLYVSKGSCFDTVMKVIRVDIPSKLEVPNVFTPNGDGSNDSFFLKVANVSDIKALIFDRWGNKVYESNSTTGNIEWDGKSMSGKELPAGTYFYIIKATGKDGVDYDQKGNVSIYK